jgi:hypothetical protein
MNAQQAPEFDVFLSYSRDDEARVHPLCDALERAGLRVWRDTGQIAAGDSWIKKIEHGLSRSRAVVLINSANALASEWVQREWNVALTLNLRIIPVRLDDAEVPVLLRSVEFIDLSGDADPGDAVREIAAVVRGELAPERPDTRGAASNPSVLGRDITVLERMIERENRTVRTLEIARWTVVILGVGLASLAALVAPGPRTLWMAAASLAIPAAVAWTITAQIRANRAEMMRLSSIKDAIELYCPKQPPCMAFRTKLEAILRERAGMKETA